MTRYFVTEQLGSAYGRCHHADAPEEAAAKYEADQVANLDELFVTEVSDTYTLRVVRTFASVGNALELHEV